MNSLSPALLEVWEVFKPIVGIIVTSAIAVYVPVIAHRINTALGLKNEEAIRDALHKAAENGVAYAQTKLATAGAGPVTVGDTTKIIGEAVDYVKSKNPDAIKKLGVGDKALTDIVMAKIGKVTEMQAAGTPSAV